MYGYTIAALLLSLALNLYANSSQQTDWSMGPGVHGPVDQWLDLFFQSQRIDWSGESGQLSLQSRSLEHQIADDFANASFIACADYDNDGWTDLACASYGDGQLAWFRNEGGGTLWTENMIEPDLPQACVVSTFDIDKNGMPDVMCASEGGDGICWWRNNDWAGSWTMNPVDTLCSYPFSVEAADFDEDGDIDLCAAQYGAGDIVWYSNDDSIGTSWTKHIIEDAFPSAWWAVPADFDGDGHVDIAGARHGGEIIWWENDGQGDFSVEHSIESGYTQCTTIRKCDINGDGHPDIVAASNGGRVAWWENTLQGTVWVHHQIDDDLQGAWSVWAGDLDGDGDSDVIGNDRKGDCVYWYENIDSQGCLWMRRDLNQGMDMSNDVYGADLDGDGLADPMATFGGDGTVYWWELGQGPEPTGCLESSILDMGQDAEWESIFWEAELPPSTGLSVFVRAGDDAENLGEWVEIPESGTDLSSYIEDDSRFFQYSVTLSCEEGSQSPVFHHLLINWIPMGISWAGDTHRLLGAPSPNPAYGSITIPLLREIRSEATLQVFDSAGRLVTTWETPSGGTCISGDCSLLPSGTYLGKLKDSPGRETVGFVLTR